MELPRISRKVIIISVLSLLLLIISISAAALYYVTHWLQTPFDPGGKPQLIEIPRGDSINKISERLEKAGIINNRVYYSLAGRVHGAGKEPKAGEYMLSGSMAPAGIMDILSKGKIYLHSITIPEGYNMHETAALLEKKGLVEKTRFLELASDQTFISSLAVTTGSTLEGYLFPSTYLFRKGEDERVIIRKMVATFKDMVYNDIQSKAASVGLTPEKVVILGSLIEKETGSENEKRIISSVFHNRLNRNMRLQCDPTVIYAIKDFDGNIRKKDLFIDSPYNTYRYPGLPPGPITNPGKTSMLAALDPMETDYLYFVATKKDGEHYFSSTIKEHNRAVRKYQLTSSRQ